MAAHFSPSDGRETAFDFTGNIMSKTGEYRPMRKAPTLVIAFLVASMPFARAQSNLRDISAIEITPKTSRPQVSAGSNFGVTVDVRNRSNAAVYLSPKYFTMCLPPELDSRSPYFWWAIFPGGQANEDPYERTIKLQPGETVAAIWAGSRHYTVPGGIWAQQYHSLSEEIRLLTFQPGEYSIKIVAAYWTDEASVGKPLQDAHSDTVDIKIPIVAPQWVIMFGAMIGGLIAYFLLPQFRLNPEKINLSGITTALLLSIIVTILLSRIADTQFFVKISVNDIWGAIAVGFLGCASGTNIIKKFLPHETQPKAEATGKIHRGHDMPPNQENGLSPLNEDFLSKSASPLKDTRAEGGQE
jgi:hypothetical protein